MRGNRVAEPNCVQYNRFMRTRSLIIVVVFLMAAPVIAGEYFIPAVAQLKGADGSYWNTELWVVNTGDSAGSYSLTFLPSRQNNAQLLLAEPVTTHALGPHQAVYLKDVVPRGKAGALRLVTSPNVLAQCRVFNASRSGSLGQMVPALTQDQMIQPGQAAVLFPLVRSARFRTNVGFFNPNPYRIDVVATLFGVDGNQVARMTYTLEPGAQAQINDILLSYRVDRSQGHQLVVEAEGPFAAYASLVDNQSGDPTLVRPILLH